MRTRRERNAKKPWEFSKKLAFWATVMATATVVVSYVLAFLGLEIASEVTTTVFTGCIGYLVTYAAKSVTEKVSRNKHGLDEDGIPYNLKGEDSDG